MALGNWPKGILQDKYDFFFEGYEEQKSMIDTLFEIKNPSEGAFDQRTTAIGAGKLVQKATEDTVVTFRRPAEAFTAYAAYRDFDDGLSLTKNEVEDFPESKVRDLAQQFISDWGRGLHTTEDDYAATLFTKGGFTAGHDNFKNVIANVISQNTDGLAYDAKPFFNLTGNERTSKGGGTYFNAISGAPLNITNFETLHNRMYISNAYNERDERINLKGLGEGIILFPPQLRSTATQVLNSEYLPGSDYNDKNPWFNTTKLVEWGALNANATTWYLGIAKKGITFYRRGKPEIRMWRDENTGRYLASIRARYGWMAWNFRPWAGANVPTS